MGDVPFSNTVCAFATLTSCYTVTHSDTYILESSLDSFILYFNS